MAVRPQRLPATEADLPDWSVYADQLLQEGDPLGEALAYELALAERPTMDEVAAFQQRYARRCWTKRRQVEVGWTLGHAKTFAVWGKEYRSSSSLDDGTLANARDLLRSEPMSLLEKLMINFTQGSRLMTRLFAALPATCTHVETIMRWRDDRQLLAMLDALPRHVTRLSFRQLPSLSPEVSRALVNDRFEQLAIYDADRATLEAALADTERVQIVLGRVAGKLLHPRCTWGGVESVGFAGTHRVPVDKREIQGYAVRAMLPLEIERRHGLIPVRTQLGRMMAESYIGRLDDRIWLTLVRRGEAWTASRDLGLVVDGVTIEPNSVVALRDGARVRASEIEGTFVVGDMNRRYRELI